MGAAVRFFAFSEAFSGGSLYSHGEKAYNGGRENLSEDEKGRTGSISLQGG
jgi:hypothetical protein